MRHKVTCHPDPRREEELNVVEQAFFLRQQKYGNIKVLSDKEANKIKREIPGMNMSEERNRLALQSRFSPYEVAMDDSSMGNPE